MALDAIKKVTDFEQEIQNQKDSAAVSAKQRIAQAQKDSQRILEDSRRQAQAQAKAMMTEAEDQAAKSAQEVLARAQTDCDALRESARGRLEKAAALIVERVVND